MPIPTILRDVVVEHKIETGGAGLVFGRTPETPFDVSIVAARAQKAWDAHGLNRITLHETRHTYASLMITAGVDAKHLCSFMGHASITVTLDLYGHLFPGTAAEQAAKLDSYLELADTRRAP